MGAVVDGGEEDDRDVPGPLPPLDVRGGLEAVHTRHLDVEQDDREVVRQQRLERFLPGRCPHQRLIERGENGLQRQQILRPVIDQEDLGLLHHAPSSSPRQRVSPAPRTGGSTGRRPRRRLPNAVRPCAGHRSRTPPVATPCHRDVTVHVPETRWETRRFPVSRPLTPPWRQSVGEGRTPGRGPRRARGTEGTPPAPRAPPGVTSPASTAPSRTAGDRGRPAWSHSPTRRTRSPSPGRPSSPSPSAR